MSPLKRRLRKRGTFESWLERWKHSQFYGCEVGTHRTKASVSSAGKSEEARCYRETFESWLQSWKLTKILEAVKTHRPKARVSAAEKDEESEVLR